MRHDQSIAELLLPWSWGLNLWRRRSLIRQFTVREIQGRYRGTLLGILWSFLTPLAMLIVYTLVFGGIFKARWPGLAQEGWTGLLSFAVAMFAGSTAYTIFSEPVARAPGVIVQMPNYVKKVVFPLEILPVVLLIAALFHALVAFVLVLLGAGLVLGQVPWTATLLPVAVIPTILIAIGMSWFLAGLGVYLRDSGQMVGVVLQVLFFATPIFYSAESIDQQYRWLLYANPLTYCIEIVRDCAVMGRIPDAFSCVIATVSGGVCAQLGYAWFMMTRKGFADVL